ncbi:hypothetical protein OHB12_22440 [Nocardia sp. NBC_01730]|uniref:hypothetical protein n=1 Tax=Nocardia sp. NBC_01730 TaxID=2975998 RepID=UPI002E161D37|nr:hypothetical protein OHB12_22440 [Nocardia sp. NBC_01730]
MVTEPDWIRDALSQARFAPYLAKTGGDIDTAIRLYWWNIDISAAFYTPLHCLELALRNAVHQRLTDEFKRQDWWGVAQLREPGLQMVTSARSKRTGRGGQIHSRRHRG